MASGLALLAFRCSGCGNCCRGLRVPVTKNDLARLTRVTGRRPEDLVEWLSPDAVDMTGEPGAFALLDAGRRVPVLAHESGACSLLDEDNRCSAHAARPTSCALYPLRPSLGKRGGIRRLRLQPAGIDCPSTRDARSSARELARLAARERAELVDHQRAVAAWNRSEQLRRRLGRRARTAADFLTHLLGS